MAWLFDVSLKLSQLSWCEGGADSMMMGRAKKTSMEYDGF